MVGPPEENGFSKPLSSPQSPQLNYISNQNAIRQVITDIHQAYSTLDGKLKNVWVNDVCPHDYGCLHYILSVSKN